MINLPHSYSILRGTDCKFSLSLSQRVSVCLSVGISWSHFLIDFRQKWHRGNHPKVRTSSLGGQHRTKPSPVLPQNHYFGSKGHANPCKHKYDNFCVKCSRIAGISAPERKLGSRNTIVTSDFRPEVEVSQVRACALIDMKHDLNSRLSYGADTTLHRIFLV